MAGFKTWHVQVHSVQNSMCDLAVRKIISHEIEALSITGEKKTHIQPTVTELQSERRQKYGNIVRLILVLGAALRILGGPSQWGRRPDSKSTSLQHYSTVCILLGKTSWAL